MFSFPEDAKKRKKQVEELASEETKPVILIKDCILMYLNEQFSLEMLSEYSEIFMDLPAAPPEGLKLVNPVYLNRESNLFKTVTDSYAVTVEREYHGVAFHVPAAWVSEDKNVFYPSNATQITISFLETLNPYMDYVFGMVEEDMEGVEERLSCRMLIGENFCEYRSVYHIDDGRMYQSDMVLLLSKREEGHVAFCLTQPVAGTEDYTADFFQLLTSCTVLGNVKEPPAEENEEIGGESLSQQIAASAASSSSESSSSLSWEEMLERLDSLS